MPEKVITTKVERISIEEDMRSKPYKEDDHFSSKVMKNYPLIGDYDISDTSLERMHANAKKYIDRTLNIREKTVYKQWVYEEVAIVVINYAKKWNSSEEGKFSKYIAMQFGYKDDSGKIWRIITEALDVAFNSNKKFFIRSANGDRHFYETVMSHSFGPADSWNPLFELLFKFYKENLDWHYFPGDPLFAKLVDVLAGYFNNTVNEDDSFMIASEHYHMRIGLRRLVQERPGYCIRLFELIVKRIDQLIKNEAVETKRYCLQLVDKWFSNRLSSLEEVSKKNKLRRTEPIEVALDYSKISVRYILHDGLPALRLPAIRISDDIDGIVIAEIYDGETVIKELDLIVQGNELGRTIKSQVIQLPTKDFQNKKIDCRIVIKKDKDIIYDSKQDLYRQILVFSDDKEINVTRIKKEKYQIFVTDIHKLNGKNVDIVNYVNGMCEIAFHKDFSLEYDGELVAVDSSNIQDVRIVKPLISQNSIYMYKGEVHNIIEKGASLKVYYSQLKEAQKYNVKINESIYSLLDFHDDIAGNRAVIKMEDIPENNRISIELINLEVEKVVFKENYCVFTHYAVEFEKPYYTEKDDFTKIGANITLDESVFSIQAHSMEELHYNYNGGTIVVTVPNIRYEFLSVGTIPSNKYVRSEDLQNGSMLVIQNHTDLSYLVKIGEAIYENESEILIGWLKEKPNHFADSIDVVIEIAGKKEKIAKVLYADQFVSNPTIVLQDENLMWDGGQTFIGKNDTEIALKLFRHGKLKYEFDLKIGENNITTFEDEFVDGQYECIITIDGGKAISFDQFLGDERKARFDDKVIQIDQVTEDVEHNSKITDVKTVFIDQIKYLDTCFVETEGDIFDVYTGCMYWINFRGEKKYYSFKYNDKRSKYKLNPVKIIYVSNRYLRIVNEDDEGIYYFYNEFSNEPGFEVTDVEPSITDKGYHDILFYLYTTNNEIVRHYRDIRSEIDNPVIQTYELRNHEDEARIKEEKPAESSESGIFSEIQDVEQTDIIKSPADYRLLVNAGPGTGKTWTLIERIIYLIQTGVEPEEIQVLCFSRAAVEVIRKRMDAAIAEERVDINAKKVDIRTFDSFASQLLYWIKESDYKEISNSFRIEKLSYEERIIKFIEVLKAQPQLIEQCAHLIVDEVQDLVLARAEMVVELIKCLPASCGVSLFGDACQAIYDYQVDGGMSSIEFYASIQRMGTFQCYTFSQNYRQNTKLQEYCNDYREAILLNDITLCNEHVTKLYEDLPDYTVPKIERFEEDSLDNLVSKGNVGILTRSNAQTLIISNGFRKKNIPHTIQRRLADNSLNGWIAMLFNQAPFKYYNEGDFEASIMMYCGTYFESLDVSNIWESISDIYSATSGKLSTKSLLLSINNKGKCKGLYTETPEADITISTIHRSKGREYDSVILLEGLLSRETTDIEEQRVNYVALSRAKERMYKVELKNTYFKTLDDKRCYSTEYSYKSGTYFLRHFEVGKGDDLDTHSFAILPDVQKYLRQNNRTLIGKEVYLRKNRINSDGSVIYNLVLKENDMVLASTSQNFSHDLCSAIRQIKNLPSYVPIYDNIFPNRFSGIYIEDFASEIGMVQGTEKDVVEHEGLISWNTLLLAGYAKAEY